MPSIETPSIVKFHLSIIDCIAAKSMSLVEYLLNGVALPNNLNCDAIEFKCKNMSEGKLSEVASEKPPVIWTCLEGESNCVAGDWIEPSWDTMGTVSSKLCEASSSPKGVLAEAGKAEASKSVWR
jgi:hypothetical protein